MLRSFCWFDRKTLDSPAAVHLGVLATGLPSEHLVANKALAQIVTNCAEDLANLLVLSPVMCFLPRHLSLTR
jgi:hypothetical protein